MPESDSAAANGAASSNVMMPLVILWLLIVAPPIVNPEAVPVVPDVFATIDVVVPAAFTRRLSLTIVPLATVKSVIVSKPEIVPALPLPPIAIVASPVGL